MAKKKPAKKPAKKPTLVQRITKAKQEAERNQEKAVKQGEKLFKEAVKEIFKKNPGLESFSFDEYAPHWNDGDECVFSVHLDDMKVNGEEDSECLQTLERLNDLLSERNAEARIIMELADTTKNKWEVEGLKRDLESIKTRDPQKVAESYGFKKAIHKLLSGIDESVYERMFGEGTVTVTRDGITVEECEHD
jgi:hypothetical protein